MPKQPHLDPWRQATAGLELVGGLLVLIAVGYGVDVWLGTKPWGLMTGAAFGIIGGLYNLIRKAMQQQASGRDSAARGPDQRRDR